MPGWGGQGGCCRKKKERQEPTWLRARVLYTPTIFSERSMPTHCVVYGAKACHTGFGLVYIPERRGHRNKKRRRRSNHAIPFVNISAYFIIGQSQGKKKGVSTDSGHRAGATGIVEHPHGPPRARAALLVGAVLLLEPLDADEAPARLDSPGYLGCRLFVLRIVVCRFVADYRVNFSFT